MCLVWLETVISCMAGDDCWLWYGLMAFSHTCTLIYIGLVALLDRTKSFSSITNSTGYKPGYRYYLNISRSFLRSLSRVSNKSLKNPKPRHNGNTRINNTKTQHHDLMMSSSESAFNKTRWGHNPKLIHNNYDEWNDDTILILSAMRAYVIVTGDHPEPQPLDCDHDGNDDDWKAKEAEAASMIRLSCCPEVRHIIKGSRNHLEMWNTLQTSLHTTGSYIGWQDILCQFCACWPKEDELLKAYFTKLSNNRIQLDHTDDANTDQYFLMQIFTSLPSQYGMLLMVLKHRRPLPTPEEAMHNLLEKETTASLTKELGDAFMGAAVFSQPIG